MGLHLAKLSPQKLHKIWCSSQFSNKCVGRPISSRVLGIICQVEKRPSANMPQTCLITKWSRTLDELTWGPEFKNHKSRQGRKRPILHSLGSFRQKVCRYLEKFTQLSQTVSQGVGGSWFENEQKCSYVAARFRCKGGQTNFGLIGGSLTDVSSDHTGSLLTSTQTLPLFLQVCTNTSILSRILARIRAISPKLIFRFFRELCVLLLLRVHDMELCSQKVGQFITNPEDKSKTFYCKGDLEKS